MLVNGKERKVPAITALDTIGNGYRFLDDETNPLLLPFTAVTVSTGLAGIDAGLWSLLITDFSGLQATALYGC